MNFSNFNDHLLKNVFLFYFWEPFGHDYSHRQERFKGVIKLMLKSTYRSIINMSTIRRHRIPQIDSKIAIGLSRNPNKDSISSLKSLLRDEYSEVPDKSINLNPDFEDLYFAYLGLRYAFHHIYWYFALKGSEKIAYRNKFWHCYYGLGMYRYIYLQLKKSKSVKCFIGTNDHLGAHQMGFVGAEKLGIPTIYIQHASVTENFPPLHVDLALLDGRDAQMKYRIRKDIPIRIELIGSPKYDWALENPTKLNVKSDTIGICINMNNEEHHGLISLCDELEKRKLAFIIRFHPHLRKEFKSPFQKCGRIYSDAGTETEIDFILRCRTVVSSDSNILLDTLVLYRRPLYFCTSDKLHDYYGFLKNGLLDRRIQTVEEVIRLVLEDDFNIVEHRNKAKHYIDTINTPFEGKSSMLALKHICSYIGLQDKICEKKPNL